MARSSLYLDCMTYKQQIVEALAEELRQILDDCSIQTRSDHGCWEVVVRRDGIKVIECTLTSEVGPHNNADEVYISYNCDYDHARVEVLSDPTWIDRFLKEVNHLRTTTWTCVNHQVPTITI